VYQRLNRAYHERDREVGQAAQGEREGRPGVSLASDTRPVDLVLQTGTRMQWAQFGCRTAAASASRPAKSLGGGLADHANAGCTDWTTQAGIGGGDFSCFGGSGSGTFYQIAGALLRAGAGALDQRVQNAPMMARLVRPERKHGALPRLRGAGRAVAAIKLCGTMDTFSRSCRTALRDGSSPD
jgi:hypothetical protein